MSALVLDDRSEVVIVDRVPLSPGSAFFEPVLSSYEAAVDVAGTVLQQFRAKNIHGPLGSLIDRLDLERPECVEDVAEGTRRYLARLGLEDGDSVGIVCDSENSIVGLRFPETRVGARGVRGSFILGVSGRILQND